MVVPEPGMAHAFARAIYRKQRVSDGYVSSVATCFSRAYCEGGRPTCRVKATLKVLAEL